MPFPKYIIQTEKTDVKKVFDTSEDKNEFDDSAFANQRMINAILHLSQLMRIAEDIFGSIESELRDVYNRTIKLNIKIENCQEVVDKLNAKTVKVPVGSLTGSQVTHLHFKFCDAEKIDQVSVFSKFPRPLAVDKLRDLANGPSPPVVIPSGMVASEVEDLIGTIASSKTDSTSTHIYCKPVKIKDAVKSRNKSDSGEINGVNKKMTTDEKVSSSVVAIDVSGQPFSRMASFRRSLIHVDFLIRRKRKKDKRRNTVAEGDAKELKDALQKLVNEEHQFAIPNGINSYQQIISDSKNSYNSKVPENHQIDESPREQNNNADSLRFVKKDDINSINSEIVQDEKSKNSLNNEGLKKYHKLNELENVPKHNSSNKRKPKSHIPISTVSAAMNVAVEMRQNNGTNKTSPVSNAVCNGNDQCSSDSDNKIQHDNRHSNSSCNEDGSQDESWTDYKKRLQDKCRSLANRKTSNGSKLTSKEMEVSSSASSDNIDPQDTTAATSTESDTFFISSDESDEDSSDIVYFQENYGSSTSIGANSDGSLNSLLSETGTEMTSSTGTLTSIGREQLLTPPPPPPPMILSATVKNMIPKISDLSSHEQNRETFTSKKITIENISQKTKPQKSMKLQKPDKLDLPKNVTESSKKIFTTLVNLKTHAKDKNKTKDKKKMQMSSHHPTFDMYGNNSPTKTKQIPAFIKENVSPVIRKHEKSHMKSFLANDQPKCPIQFSDSDNKDKFDIVPYKNSPNTDYLNTSDIIKSRTETINSIPLKYEHKVTVTPVQRPDFDYKEVYNKGSFVTQNHQSLRQANIQRLSSLNADNQIYVHQFQRSNPPGMVQYQDRTKSAARVVLDLDGKVIYTTNSLDRKQHNNSDHTVNMYSSAQNQSCDPYFKHRKFHKNGCNLNNETNFQNFQAHLISDHNTNMPYPQDKSIMYSPTSLNHNVMEHKSGEECYRKNIPYLNKQTYTSQSPTSNSLSPENHKSPNMQTFVPKKTGVRPFSYAGVYSSDFYLSNPSDTLLPDPNVSGLPVQETMLTRHNVNLHSKQMERMKTFTPEDSFYRISNTFCTSPSSQTSNESILNKSPQSTMSTEDLFAVIHNCKKRMNIKTDSDISLASSSRSSSPSFLRPSSSKGTLVETGFLSPRSKVHLETSGDRRSWADFRPVESLCNERKSLASDRLGPTKPTSMHDFKMLLLQARSNSHTSGQRKSAVEMLKLPLNQNSKNAMSSPPLNLSPRNSISFSAQNSPTAELSLYNGHSTVPFKRGNRVRTSLQSRYIMYPPIFEDCSEDLETCSDNINKPTVTITSKENVTVKDNLDCANPNKKCIQNQEYLCDSQINSHAE